MSDLAIRVENLSKLYHAHSLVDRRPGVGRAGHIGAIQQRNDTLREALSGLFRRNDKQQGDDTNLWALRDVSFETCLVPKGCFAKRT